MPVLHITTTGLCSIQPALTAVTPCSHSCEWNIIAAAHLIVSLVKLPFLTDHQVCMLPDNFRAWCTTVHWVTVTGTIKSTTSDYRSRSQFYSVSSLYLDMHGLSFATCDYWQDQPGINQLVFFVMSCLPFIILHDPLIVTTVVLMSCGGDAIGLFRAAHNPCEQV